MNILLNFVIKSVILPYVANWLIKRAENNFPQKKSGLNKKEYVEEGITDFLFENNIIISQDKISNIIEKRVKKIIK